MKLQNNIKGLTQDFSEFLEQQMVLMRKNTPFEHVRPSDAKTFMLISRNSRSISELAMSMQVSRQAAHKSVGRLIELEVVIFDNMQTDKRNKVPILTQKGQDVRKLVFKNIGHLENQLVEKIGTEKVETLRSILIEILA